MKGLALRRKGAWLISDSGQLWQMSSVQGPLSLGGDGREYFKVETTGHAVLLISRHSGERGMRELRLESICSLAPHPQERSSVA